MASIIKGVGNSSWQINMLWCNYVGAVLLKKGLDVLNPRPVGDYAAFRVQELGAAMNRLRTLSVRMKD